MDFDFIPSLVTTEDDVGLCRESNMDEVRRVVFFIDSDYVPGPNGFYSRFCQSNWDIVCCDLLDVILDYFRGSAVPRIFRVHYWFFFLRSLHQLFRLIFVRLASVM